MVVAEQVQDAVHDQVRRVLGEGHARRRSPRARRSRSRARGRRGTAAPAPASGGAPGCAGHDSTLVGCALPRNAAFSAAMRASSQASSADLVPLGVAARRRRAPRAPPARPAPRSRPPASARPRPPPRPAAQAFSAPAGRARLVGADDLGHQRVAHHVLGAETGEADPLDAAQDALGLDQPGSDAAGQVDLGGVAGHRHAAALAEAGQEHLHLHGGGVLRLVEHHEGVRQRAARA